MTIKVSVAPGSPLATATRSDRVIHILCLSGEDNTLSMAVAEFDRVTAG